MKNRKYLKLSDILKVNTPEPSGIPSMEIYNFNSIVRNSLIVSKIIIILHSGTHVEESLHVISDGKQITNFGI